MASPRLLEGIVGCFVLMAILAFIFLAFKVSGLTTFIQPDGYIITATFDDIGQLKVRAPVKLAGVRIGEVGNIMLDPTTFKAIVKIRINNQYNTIPVDSQASILTAGLLGDNYISIDPMYSESYLHEGSEVKETHSAIILEKLLGQLLFKLRSGEPSSSAATPTPTVVQSGKGAI